MPSKKLTFSDGSSNKFWNIDLSGDSHTVNYGKIGTAGQTKTKEFDSGEEARKSFDKLIAQKLKKGYAESGGSSNSTAAKKSSKAAKKSKTTKKSKVTKASKASKSTAEKKAAAAPKKKAVEFDLSVTNDLGLSEVELRRSSFHKLPPLKKQAQEEGTLEEAMEDFLKKVKAENYGWELNFKNVPLTYPMSKPIAHFWFHMMARTTRVDGQRGLVKFLAACKKKRNFDGKLSKQEAKKILYTENGRSDSRVVLALASLFSPLDCLEMLFKPTKPKKGHYGMPSGYESLIIGFCFHLLPRLSEAEKSKLRTRVKKSFDPAATTSNNYVPFPGEHYIAAALGMHREIAKVVSSWDDDRYSGDHYRGHYEMPDLILTGLKSAADYETQWRHLKLQFHTPDRMVDFIANTGVSGLDLVADHVCSVTNKQEAAKFVAPLVRIRAPEAAEPILQCRIGSKAAAAARDWMNFNVGNCIAGLIETAGQKGKLGDAAIDYYREMKRNGHEALIAKYVKKAGKKSAGGARIQKDVLDHVEKVYTPLDAKTTPKWLKTELGKVDIAKPPKIPAWASVNNMAPLTVGDRKLNDEQVETVLKVLATTPVDQKSPLLESLKENVDPATRDAFAWQLFELWLEGGSVSKQKWAMGSIAHLGGDACVLKLTPLVRVWPGESQHQRAVYGLQCLRGVGTNTALMELSGIAQKLKFKGLKQKAGLFVEEIAKDKGMTRDELEDRVIPDCGLDEMGRREISYGSRKFDFVLGGDLKPMVRDEKGKVRPNPPKPSGKDDEKIANESLAQWKLAKKQIKQVAVLQSSRLEQAMVRARRWPIEDFEKLLVRHPLMTHLVQKLIWGSFAKNGKRQKLFRVTEERDYADATDKSLTLPKTNTFGIVHPLELNEKEKASWGEILSDYEIISPFQQLGRPVYSFEAAEKKKVELERFHGLKLYAPTMVFTLEKLGWVRGEAMDGGGFDEHSKQFPAYDVTAVIGYDGCVGMGYVDPEELLTTESVHFCKGMRAPSGYRWDKSKKFKLGEVPELVASEVMADLNVLQSKAQ